jgi:hypothetical protein
MSVPKKNMTISIHYPTGTSERQMQPVSIHVDPFGSCNPPWAVDKSDSNSNRRGT